MVTGGARTAAWEEFDVTLSLAKRLLRLLLSRLHHDVEKRVITKGDRKMVS